MTVREIGSFRMDESKKLGFGSQGGVFLGINKVNKELVAIKKIQIQGNQFDQQINQFEKEIEVMKQLNHQNLVKLITSMKTLNNFYIIMEYCEGGTLNEYIKKKSIQQNSTYLAESEARIILRQILSGYKHLYDKKIVHRDLKPSNILMKRGQIKIADFGVGKILQNFEDQVLKTYVGTPLYMSPQLHFFDEKGQYTSKTDIWSLGVIFYEVLFGKTPWEGSNYTEISSQIFSQKWSFPEFPQISKEMKIIIQKMLQFEEKDRMSWEELFQLQYTFDKQNQQIMNISIIKIKNETNNMIKRNLEKNLYINNYTQNIEHARKIQQEIENVYPNILQNNLDSQDSPVKFFSQRTDSQKNEGESLLENNICLEIQDWINHKTNKSTFLNHLSNEMINLYQNGFLELENAILNIMNFILTKYSTLILYKIYTKLKSKSIENTNKKYSPDSWKKFCSTDEYKTALQLTQNQYSVVLNCLKNTISATEQTILEYKGGVFKEVLQICNIQQNQKQIFDPIFVKVIYNCFNIILNSVEVNKLNKDCLRFLINLKECQMIHTKFKFRQIDWFKRHDELQNLNKEQLKIRLMLM